MLIFVRDCKVRLRLAFHTSTSFLSVPRTSQACYPETGHGCFSDEHESEENKSDRVTRFLPEHDKYFKSNICEFSYQEQILPIDSRLVDVDGNDLIEARVTLYDIVDKGGTRMSIDMGGIIPDGEEPVHVLTSHDKSCFAVGDFESKVTSCALRPLTAFLLQAWQHKAAPKKRCKSKSTGPKYHISSFSTEYGNDQICLRPDQPRTPPITLKELRT